MNNDDMWDLDGIGHESIPILYVSPHPLTPSLFWEQGNQIQNPSPRMGEGYSPVSQVFVTAFNRVKPPIQCNYSSSYSPDGMS